MSAGYAGRGNSEYEGDGAESSGIWRGDNGRGGIWRGESGRGANGPDDVWTGQGGPPPQDRDRRNPASGVRPGRTAGRGRPQEPPRSRDPRETGWPRDPAQRQPRAQNPAAAQPPRSPERQGNWPPAPPRDPGPRRRDGRSRDPYAAPGGDPRGPAGPPDGLRDPRTSARYAPGERHEYAPDPGYPQDGYRPAAGRVADRGYSPDRGYPPGRGYPAGRGYPPDERYPAGGEAYGPGGDYRHPAGDAFAPSEGLYPPRGDEYPARGDEDGGWDDGDADDRFLPGFGGDEDDHDGAGGGRGRRRGRKDRRGRDYPGDDDFGGPGGPGDGGGRKRRRGLRRLAPAAALVLLLVIAAPLAIGGFFAYRFIEGKFFPADYSGPGTAPNVMVQVKSGDTASSLGPRLQGLGVVASSRAFVLAAEHSTNTAGLEAGFYRLRHHMQASVAYQDLLNPANRVQLTITFPEGLRTSQLAVVLGERSGIPLSDYQHVLSNPAHLGLPSYAGGKPEGYLFPATYQVQPNATALSVLQAMVQRFNQEAAADNLPAAAARLRLTSAQAIIVASLVQAEGGRLSDYGKIARVVYNRLAQHMKLQFDSTVFYGLGLFGTAATGKEISTPGPYNTYLNYGLPPGPIDNPGNAAIEAALHPAPGNWLYFISFKNGASEFSPTPLPGQG